MRRAFPTLSLAGSLGIACASSTPATDGGSDAGSEAFADAPSCCTEPSNQSSTVQPDAYEGSTTWLAWPYTPKCSFGATSLEMPSDAPAVGILSDDAGKPGAVLLPETATTLVGARQIKITFAPIPLTTGKPVWIAIKHKMPGCITCGTLMPTTTTGQMTPNAFSQTTLAGPWTVTGMSAKIFTVSNCM